MAINLRCLFKHKWLYGRAPRSEVILAIGWKNMHNRACVRCPKEDFAADRADAEFRRRQKLSDRLRSE